MPAETWVWSQSFIYCCAQPLLITYYGKCSNLQPVYLVPELQCMHKYIRDLPVAFPMFSGQQNATEVSFKQAYGCNFAPASNFGSPAARWDCLLMHTFVSVWVFTFLGPVTIYLISLSICLVFCYSFARQRQTSILTGQYSWVLEGRLVFGQYLEFLHGCSLCQNVLKVPGDFADPFSLSEMLLWKETSCKGLILLLLKLVAKLLESGEKGLGSCYPRQGYSPGFSYRSIFVGNLPLSSEAVNYSSPSWNKMLWGQRDKG